MGAKGAAMQAYRLLAFPVCAGVAQCPMYLVETWSSLRLPRGESFRSARLGVGGNIVALGVTSLLTDISSEMVSTVLPVYLVLHLGLTPLQFGLIDGMYHGLGALFRVITALAADRWQRYKEIAAGGYGISAICKIGLGIAGSAWPLIAGIVAADRIGKAVRTAPRDALISLSTTPAKLGIAFGVHRAFDSAGAMLGPVVALGILAALPERFDVVFVASFSVAVIGLGVLLLFVHNVGPSRALDPDAAARTPETRALPRWRDARVLGPLIAASGLLSVTTVSDAFLYLLLQRQAGLNAGLFPLLYVGTAAGYLVLAVPAGRLADRVGRRVTLLAGHVLMVLACLITLGPSLGLLGVAICVLLLGAYYALTDGVVMALAGSMCAPAHRASGMALMGTVTSGGRFFAAIAFGALWTRFDAATAVSVFVSALVAAIVLASVIFKIEKEGSERHV